jgi:hypothetical protein
MSYSDIMDALVEIWGANSNKYFIESNAGADFMLELTTKADIFSFGMVLVKLQRYSTDQTVERKGGVLKAFLPRSTKLKNAGAPEIWVAVEDLERFGVPAEEAAWHVSVANRISIPLHTLMTKMAQLDPRKAISIDEALAEYTKILPAIRELYQPSKLYKALKAVDEHPELAAPIAPTKKSTAKPSKNAAAAAAAAAASTPTPAAKASSPKPRAPTSTRKLKLDEAQTKALAKKKKALEKARKEAAEELQEAQDELSEVKRKRRDVDEQLDKAKRDKMEAKVITKFTAALAKYDGLVAAAEKFLEDTRAEGIEAVANAQAAYNTYRAGLPRL